MTDRPVTEISDAVMSGNVFILKNVFKEQREDLVELRRAVFRWAQETAATEQPDPTANCHCRQAGVSKLQKTPHVYHSYNFNRLSELPSELSAQLYGYFEPLRVFQNALTGNAATFENFDGVALHPQIIQYPAGGGIFGRHHHPLNPQRIGLIVGLTRRGVDYDSGGTGFDVDGTVIDIEADHDLGDVALFRFDIPHWVNPSNLRHKFDWDSEAGRWTMVLPYY
jgi:hypothetical protein